MSPVAVIDPALPIVSLALTKQHLCIDAGDTDNDTLIQTYMAAAQGSIDGPGGWLGRAIGQQTLELSLSGLQQGGWGWSFDSGGLFWGSTPPVADYSGPWCAGRITLPYPPLLSVTSVKYLDDAGVEQTVPSADYLSNGNEIEPAYQSDWPAGRSAPGAVKVRYVAGYETPPAPFVAAVLLMVGGLWGAREDVVIDASRVTMVQNPAADRLLAPFRVWS